MKKISWAIIIIVGGIQLIPHPTKNQGVADGEQAITHTLQVNDEVASILKTSCYDCHSNHTDYPWYANIQPFSLWIGHHIDEGKEELNFSEFKNYSIRRKYHKLEEIIEQVNEGEMPMSSYTLIHQSAKLNQAKKDRLTQWAQSMMDSIRTNVPADSLVRKKRVS